ncbi:MAG: hypothetical protein QNI84_11950 [Henriciella sp.]|nr:hypothetical protein [Henriciella sp.]
MPPALFFPILLRAAGPLAFIIAALIAGGMNRAVILVPLLAIVATLTTAVIRATTPSPTQELMAALNDEAEPAPQNPFSGSLQRLGAGLLGYSFLFAVAALIAAVFQVTEFNPSLTLQDLPFLIAPAIIALIGASISSRMGFNQMANMMGQMREAMAQMQPDRPYDASSDEAFTVEGEIIDKDDRSS